MKTALVTPCLSHLPFHPSVFLGYGAAILAERYELDVIDLSADLHFKNRGILQPVLDVMDKARVVSDVLHLSAFYEEIEAQIDRHYAAIPWNKYDFVYVTPPSWFPMVAASEVLRLSRAIKRVSADTRIFFFGNSLASWTKKQELEDNGVHSLHLNNLFTMDATAQPVKYDLLPVPFYHHRENYLFDLLPFTLKHGCPWGRCRFCSLSKGWNSGYLMRSIHSATKELKLLIDQHDPKALVCRDHSLKGQNLIAFCGCIGGFNKPWCGQSRADLTEQEITALGKAGCRELYFGLESGSDRTLQLIKKGITSKQMSAFIKRLHYSGILPVPSLIIGIPGETNVDYEKTIQFIDEHSRYLDVVNVYPFMATPSSEFSLQLKQPEKLTSLRLLRFIQTCKDLGLKVVIGEQAIEYFIFERTCKGRFASC